MRLVASSDPNLKVRYEALELVAKRAVLTRTVCRELLDSSHGFVSWRASAALAFLFAWLQENFPRLGGGDITGHHGLDEMAVPDDCEAVLSEIRSGADVCDAFFWLTTADKSDEFNARSENLKKLLDVYWREHGTAAKLPRLHQ